MSSGQLGPMSDSKTGHAALRTTESKAVMAGTDQKEQVKNYKGFVAGVFSGIAKLTGKPTSSYTFIASV
jgi:hypothetical protein